ncbi:hypothetical protein BK144_02195 [Paenibacillus sp. FSL R7-0273]|nr:hypothetical protein BK144_02195 [Paenibacillus sp. FSL R7-0273]
MIFRCTKYTYSGWWLVAGGWWLVAGGWWLVAGGWWLVQLCQVPCHVLVEVAIHLEQLAGRPE